MTSRESKGNLLSSNSDNSIGMTPANDFTKVADVNNGEFRSDLALPLSLTSSSARLSKSKVIKKHAIHLIRFCKGIHPCEHHPHMSNAHIFIVPT